MPTLLCFTLSVDDENYSEICEVVELRKEKREKRQEDLREKVLNEKKLRANLVKESKQIKYISKSTPLLR